LPHQFLNRSRWNPRLLSARLLSIIVERFVPDGPVVIGMDDTIERRWGQRIAARGIYRDPVRSSHGHFVKASGLRWLSFMVLSPVPWARCIKALPVLTILCPSERHDQKKGRRHKLLTDWARQGVLQLCRWLPEREIIFVGDSSFAVHTLAGGIRGFDAGKKIKGRKRHIIVDTLGLMVGLMVHSAYIQDRDGAPDLLKSFRNRWPWLLHVFADGGYAGDKLKKRLQKMGKWTLESSNVPIRPRVLKSCRAAGSSSGPSHGWVDAAGWPRTSKNPSLQQKRGSQSLTSACSQDASQDTDIVEPFSSPTLIISDSTAHSGLASTAF